MKQNNTSKVDTDMPLSLFIDYYQRVKCI